MRVAHINAIGTPCPPPNYGGTERCIAQMVAFQAAICAYDVSLYASSDSHIVAYTAEVARQRGLAVEINRRDHVVCVTTSDGKIGRVTLRTTGHPAPGYRHASCAELDQMLVGLLLADEQRRAFDLIHSHHRRVTINALIPAGLATKTLTHAHSPTLEGDYGQYRYPLICISNSQAELLQENHGANVFEVIYHGLDHDTYTATPASAGYLAWLGHFAWKKGPDAAIKIAKKVGRPLILAGMLREKDEVTQRYAEDEVEPHIDAYDTSFVDRIAGMTSTQIDREISLIAEKAGAAFPVISVGPVTDVQKQVLFGNAMATLFPVRWAEPFGLVMIESMACGTPVIGYANVGAQHCGAIEEVIANGVTGYHVRARDEDDAVMRAAQAVISIPTLARAEVRRVFERDWNSERVVRQLDASYRRFLAHPEQYLSTPRAKQRWGKRKLKKIKKKMKLRKRLTKQLPRALGIRRASKEVGKPPAERRVTKQAARILRCIPLLNDYLMSAAKIYNDVYFGFSYDSKLNGENAIIRRISDVFKDNTIFFDVGANVGEWTAEVFAQITAAKVHLFELSPATFETLAQRYNNQSNIYLNNLGLANESGEVEFKNFGKDFGINTLILDTEVHKKEYTLSKAQITRGDAYCLENNIERINFLKIDTEGTEYSVLQGFETMIANNSVDIVQFEYGYANGDAKILMKDFYAFFEQYGYIVGPLRIKGVQFKPFDYADNNFLSGPNYIACLPMYRDLLSEF